MASESEEYEYYAYSSDDGGGGGGDDDDDDDDDNGSMEWDANENPNAAPMNSNANFVSKGRSSP
jgi:hypothetical protein